MIYNNNQNTPFSIYITNLEKYNEGFLIGKWVNFPTTKEHIADVLEKIDVKEGQEIIITDYNCNIPFLSKYLSEYSNLNELNYLAKKIEDIENFNRNKFNALIEAGEGIENVSDIINIIDNLDDYNLIIANNEEELGISILDENDEMQNIPDWLSGYIDYESYGRDYSINTGAMLTSEGYIYSFNCSKEYYKGIEDIPEECFIIGSKQPIEEKTDEIELDVL